MFSLIGGGVFVAGLALQVALVRYAHTGPDWSYAAQAVFSIELSYLLNRYLTWRDRTVGFWGAAWKFNAQKALMTVVNMAAYAFLVRLGIEYIAANIALTAIFTPINYFAGDLFVFARGARGGPPEIIIEPRTPMVPPTVSVVIPCKGSERTIRATVESFLGQDYPALTELILVGDVGDSTWTVLDDINDPRLVLLEQERTPGRRDPNVKRDKGITKSSGDVIALADSDIVVDPGWIGRAVALINGQGGGLVAGGMRSIHDTFWGRFVDNNVLAAKTPRVSRPYRVTAESFGARGYKPPVTANAIFTRKLYDECPLDVSWAYGYEDYEWFWRLAKEGQAILFSSDLTAAHHHRRSFRHLVREYRQSAHGCAQFIRAHPDSPLARKRTIQAFGLPVGALAALGVGAFAVTDGYGVLVAGLLAMGAVLVTGREVSRVRSLESLTYPAAGLALGGIYAASIAGSLLVPPATRPQSVPTWDVQGDEPRHRRPRRLNSPLLLILGVQAALSLALVWSNTVFGDEALYLSAGTLEWMHWLRGTVLPAAGQPNFGFGGTFASYFSGAPQIYPPIGAAVSYVSGLAGARILGLAFMLGANILLYLTTKRIFGGRAALFSSAMWAVCASVLRLSFATYDPMAIFLICLGTWTAVEAGYRLKRKAELLAVTAIILALGAVTSYAYAVFIPAVIAVALTSWAPTSGWRRSIISSSWLAGVTCMLLVAVPTVLKLWQGIFYTTLSRASGNNGLFAVLRISWEIIGIFVIIAVIGVFVARHSERDRRWVPLLVCCAASAMLVPVEQLRLQTATSLDKHLALGAWFAAIGCGYALSVLTNPIRLRKLAAVACAACALAIPAVDGWTEAFSVYHLWPNAAAFISAMRPLMAKNKGNVLVVQYSSTAEYYLGKGGDWQRWASVSLDLSYEKIPQSKWPAYYRSQIGTIAPKIIAIPLDVAFTSLTSGEVLLNNLTQSLKDGKQSEVRRVLLQIAAADISTQEPGLYDLASVVADDPQYRIVQVVPLDSHIATGVFVIWQRSPVVTSHGPTKAANP
ncbi:MAG TPA: glycosyltransferase [Streptosporangiaceae bacterium]